MDKTPQQGFGGAQAPAQAQSGFGTVERDEGTTWLTPGLHTVAITKVVYEQPATGKPYIGVTMATSQNQVTTQRFYVSPGALPHTLTNLVHLFNKVASDEELNALTWPEADYAAMCAAISPLVTTGEPIEIKLSGEEYQGRINAKFAFRPFAQKVDDDKLFFSPDTDIKREETADMTSSLGAPPVAPGAVEAAAPGAAPAPGLVIPGSAPQGPQ